MISDGSTTITAIQSATSNYNSATTTAMFVVLSQSPPTLGPFVVSNKTFGDADFVLVNPTSNSVGLWSYASSDTSVISILGSICTIIGAGSVTITATQAETASHTSASVTALCVVSKATPNLATFAINGTHIFGGPDFQLFAPTSNSLGLWTFASSDMNVVQITNDYASIIGAGLATITAIQTETSNYTSGSTTALCAILKATPDVLDFSPISKTFGDSPFVLTVPTSDSDGVWSFTSQDTTVATVFGTSVSITGAGSVQIVALQAETSNYNAVTKYISLTVSKATPSLGVFFVPTSKVLGALGFDLIAPTSTGSGSWIFTTSNSSVISISSGNRALAVGIGIANIVAIQESSSNWQSAQTTSQIQVVASSENAPVISGTAEELEVFMSTFGARFCKLTENVVYSSNVLEPLSQNDEKMLYVVDSEDLITGPNLE